MAVWKTAATNANLLECGGLARALPSEACLANCAQHARSVASASCAFCFGIATQDARITAVERREK